MGKIKANLADIKTTFEAIMPGDYEFKISKIEDKSKTEAGIERPAYLFVSVVDEIGNEEYGKPVYHNLSLTKKDGSPNTAGLAELKRYAEAILGEDRANSDDLDTDELLNGRFRGVVIHEEYQGKPVARFKTVQSL